MGPAGLGLQSATSCGPLTTPDDVGDATGGFVGVGEGALGVVGVDMAVDTLQAELSGVRLYEEGFGRLISWDGTVLVHPFADRVGRTAPEWTDEQTPLLLANLRNGLVFTDEYLSIASGEITIKSFVPLFVGNAERPMVCGTVVSPDEVYASVVRLISFLVPIMIGGLFLVAVALFLLIRWQMRPLDVARRALKDVAQASGDLTRRRSRPPLNLLQYLWREPAGHHAQHSR